jgi:hypothetical protein
MDKEKQVLELFNKYYIKEEMFTDKTIDQYELSETPIEDLEDDYNLGE